MIITCPNCATSYRVANAAITSVGRQVRCASCAQTWQAGISSPSPATPKPATADEKLFSADYDEDFTEADEYISDEFIQDIAKTSPYYAHANEQSSFGGLSQPNFPSSRRDNFSSRAQPRVNQKSHRSQSHNDTSSLNAKLSDVKNKQMSGWQRASIAGAVALTLVSVVAFSNSVIQLLSSEAIELNGFFDQPSLGDFTIGDVKTLRTKLDGNEAINVSAKISNTSNRITSAPDMRVSLIDNSGVIVYEWQLKPTQTHIPPYETIDVSTKLTSPPLGVERVRLSFVER